MKTRLFGPALLLGLLVFSIAGCGAKATAGAITSGATTSGATTVTITVTEFKIVSSLTSFTMGTAYHFVVTNNGQAQHELMTMPVAKGTASETARDASKLFEVADINPGQTKSADYTFTSSAPAGTLEFACHVPGHYEAGMRLAIIVR
jgi:uncharacterized cupredoxin-like copper-binding protein